ncbi:MAG TPA: hypothetical protein VFA71_04035 [Terriglobales bacterium]|nr:hypothetical protein [Terriglobales bacterium]
MASAYFERFRESMAIDYMKWHDGIGYDLEALRQVTEEERELALDILISREAADWRDIEALDCLGSPRALKEIKDALKSNNIEVKIEAAERLVRRELLDNASIESLILDALDSATLTNGMTMTLRFARAHATPSVRQKLLWCALYGNDDIRVHAAALSHYLHGQSASAFDWSFRPLYLRFRSKEQTERQAAFIELCRSMNIDPDSIKSRVK